MLYIEVKKRLRDYELDVCLNAKDAQLIALTGRNGSGKTTLLNLVAGLTNPDGGRIVVGEETLYDSKKRICVPTEKRNVGYVFQHYALFPHLTVYGNVAFGLKTKKMQWDEVRIAVDECLTGAGLYHLRDERIQNLSGGEKQKIALARTLITRPRLLLLDEPLSALDSRTREKYRTELKENVAAAGIPAIMVTHDPADAAIADKVYNILDGRITWE